MENVNIRINALAAQLDALKDIPRTFAFNARKALTPVFADPLAVLKVSAYRLTEMRVDHTDLDTEKRPTGVILASDEAAELTRISKATLLPRDIIIRLMLDYYLTYTRKGEDPAGIYQ